MAKISRQEVLNIARMTHIGIHKEEVEPLIDQLQQVLSYAERVREIAQDVEEPSIKNINVFREDVVVTTDAVSILDQSQEREGCYFVVPIILGQNE